MLLSVSNLAKAYGDNQVLNGVTFTLHAGDKWGLVGANGVGKSTLVKIITGEVEPDAGVVQLGPDAEIGYLPQVLTAAAGQTIGQLLAGAQARLHTLEARLRELELLMAAPPDGMGDRTAGLADLLAEYGHLGEEFERLGGYDGEHRVAAVLGGLGVDYLAHDRPLATLSGGEKARVGLAALLLQGPGLLLLDEPTNHLDFSALGWLEGFLADYRGAVLVVSHDRQFLNATVRGIVEIEEHSREAVFYNGSYDFFAAAKAQAYTRWVEEYAAQQEEIRELRRYLHSGVARRVGHNRPGDGDKLAYNYKGARVEDSVGHNIRAAQEKLRRIEADPVPKPPQPLHINPEFDPAALANKTPLALSGVTVAYGDRVLLDDITLTVGAGDRIVLVGPNGVGKTTLLKVMARRLQPGAGSVTTAASTVIGYLDQEQETLSRGGTLYDAYVGERTGEWEELKVELLSYGLFTWPDLLKPVASLSIGQQRKLQIAQLMAARANLLLLDEPTNHISLDVLEQFEGALLEFKGAIVAISHDRRFLARVAGQIWELRAGRLIRYLGGWEEYQARSGKERTQ
jgi:macrolide transport system ATP-binding/permease protein